MPTVHHHPPSLDDIAAIAEAALAEIPPVFRDQVSGVALRVDEFPDDETLDALGLEVPTICSASIAGWISATSNRGPWSRTST